MRNAIFLYEFEVLLKQLHTKKAISNKKKSLVRRMSENPLFHLNSQEIQMLAPTQKESLESLFEKLHDFV
jgi:hypothetical protein